MTINPKDLEKTFQDLSTRLKQAYDKLPPEAKATVDKLVGASHAKTLFGLGKAGDSAEDDGHAPHQLSLVRTALDGGKLGDLFEDVAAVVEFMDEEADKGAWTPPLGSEGEIWWIEKYQQLDPAWLESAIVWLENTDNKVTPFPTNPATITIPDQTTIAVVGDWGTGSYDFVNPKTPSQQVVTALATHNPDYSIHLGDVYYAGTADEEQSKFLEFWHNGSKGSFALNSNHEMMDGGHGYFGTLLANSAFSLQDGCSYFALENSNWVIIGLDSSYNASWAQMYGPGNLNSVQQQFLNSKANAAYQAGKTVIIMCHQNGLTGSGEAQADAAKDASSDLWTQVTSNLPADATAYWYWGHQHIGVVYAPKGNILARCSGHGAIPWGTAKALQSGQGAGDIDWFETTQSPDVPYEIMNGFTILAFDGENLTEKFYDQTGNLTWSSDG